ncbi:MAG: ATP-dependent DNA helicase RecG, partial [Rhodobacteraceae bacterium]|nr:ATP-dependent DNA helicase RecG [Paracoccaceae bacterium]
VGSGKTVVAFLSLLSAVEAGGQGVLMAPTEILVQQHLENLRPLGNKVGVVVDALTGRDKGKERDRKLAALLEGKIHILIGTHAVFQSGVHFLDLRLAIIDEQHRFGVRQRLALGEKGQSVDVLVMTATPIPRSLALSQYGEMDLTVLTDKPAGRKPVKTVIISDNRVNEIVLKLKKAIDKKNQAYWVCPLIEESDVLDYTAAEDRFKALRANLGEGEVGLVHGQMNSDEKDEVMKKFSEGEIKVLVSTTVIEVGVDVPSANIIVIEHAEKFGLAQLHQLRGRVGRGTSESSCILLYKAPLSENGERRLSILRETEDGFKIAELDLQMRGAGDMIGTAQSGLPRFRIADIYHQELLIDIAQKDARVLLEKDPTLRLTKKGNASRNLLWLMGQEQAFRLLSVG